ncbi:O-methyltransferase-domain-containing protein [Thelonectria olida]|uniref:O-methyltransferase-domain-containing protein n=1 Tax=Thelonectria olida TaxID=1576542 RepID=A0A9P9AHY1_9HYPO|nr:O-methyltransferase-domain-containing protein [Thelonectria olida]
MADSGRSTVDISVATAANNIEAVPSLLEKLAKKNESLQTISEQGRKELLSLARALVRSLETPRETMAKHCWAQTGVSAAVSLGVEVGLWKLMVSNGDRPQLVQELATVLSIEPALLSRLMRHLGALGYVTETGENEYKPTNYSKALSLDIIGNGYIAMLSGTSSAVLLFHEYARKRGYKNPDNASDTSLMMTSDTNLDVFSWLRSLGYGAHFNDHMAGYRHGRTPWMVPSVYPVEARLVKGADTSCDAPFLVDIGGNRGHDLKEFHKYHPSTPGRLYLQDTEIVIHSIESLPDAITSMPYDFFTEQPIKGARAYYIHSCLHDWPDDKCKMILSHIRDAMKHGYSKLLIHEFVMPRTGAHWEATSLDLIMMSLVSAKERTETEWYSLIESVLGLKIVDIWQGGEGAESLIECELVAVEESQ